LVRHAARHATPKQVQSLAIALADNKRSLGSPESFTATDMAFHMAIAEIPRSSIFTALNAALSTWLADQRMTSMRVKGSERHAFTDHERIYHAVAGHDVEAADRAMADHLTHVSEFYWVVKDRKKSRK